MSQGTTISPTKYTTQQMQNYGFDDSFKNPTVEQLGYDGKQLQRQAASALDMQLDYVNGTNPIYMGIAAPGSLTSVAVWQIKKITYDSNNNAITIQYANGSPDFNSIWDNRASLSYS